MEHRYSDREALEMKVRLCAPNGSFLDGHLKNISRTGATLVVASAPPPGNVVEVTIFPSSDLPMPVNPKARGYVVWVKGSELGVLWIDRCEWARLAGREPETRRQWAV